MHADQLHPLRETLAQAPVLAHRDVRLFEAQPQLALREGVQNRVEQVPWRGHAVERCVHLRGGLLDVAEVGHEHPHVRSDQRAAVAAREAGQVAHVDQVRDEHEVGAGVREDVYEALAAAAHSPISARRRSSASR